MILYIICGFAIALVFFCVGYMVAPRTIPVDPAPQKAVKELIDDLKSQVAFLKSENNYLRGKINRPTDVKTMSGYWTCVPSPAPVVDDNEDKSREKYGYFEKHFGDTAYLMFIRGASRKEIAKKLGAPYPTVCKAIQRREANKNTLF